ncbi:unnamed protein product [Kuraishia capsulata CBS 1993]|uniref:Signal recognition particle receptor subunit alpha homolog n=1 Tax=Kuraishia capsulata CBS 1993 TaxID=1382522 RepID=W6MMX7_9ASCO|nr:uncharacterized protein KUCA_T00003536001 [Kuraishia capsulata CBS 1993]CDK27558.1 unnamed protein product [Kuraishia capsulata CBS 1993]
MVDLFEIFAPSGKVVYKYEQQKNFRPSIINSFVSDILISERKDLSADDDEHYDSADFVGTYTSDGYTVKYTKNDEPSLYFVVVYSSLTTYRRVEEFLRTIKLLYLNSDEEKFDAFFKLKLGDLEVSSDVLADDATNEKPVLTPVSKIDLAKNAKKASKKGRKWGADGSVIENDVSDVDLDFSTLDIDDEAKTDSKLAQLVGDKSKFGAKSKTGEFLVSDLSSEIDSILANSKANRGEETSSVKTQPFGFLRKYLGGKKITREDITKTKSLLIDHLVKKNVAPTVASSLAQEVEKDLSGATTQSFTSVEETSRKSLEKALVKLLTPNSSIDLLKEIQKKKNNNELPYVISVVGVNGVGKSTNLSKLAFWLLQNNYRVLITACDTFRSGAVEQLNVHVNNLKKLTDSEDGISHVELFQGGYGGADLVAKIATSAIQHAKKNGFDIVLMDTAGRRHNDAHLMAPLQSFAKAAKPDKIIMVGEALVGTDSVLQAQNFNKAFGAGRTLDFFIISKCDTVGDLIGSMVNMVYATGIPILFVGTGQTYTDLRTLSVDWAVRTLMS